MSIHKDNLIGKNVEFMDESGKFRIGKVLGIKKGTKTTGKGKFRKKETGIIVSIKYGIPKKSKKRSKVNRATETVMSTKVHCWIHHGHIKEDIIWDDKKDEKKPEKKPEKKEKKTKEKKQEEPYKVQPVVKEHVDVEPKEPKTLKQVTLFDIVGDGA